MSDNDDTCTLAYLKDVKEAIEALRKSQRELFDSLIGEQNKLITSLQKEMTRSREIESDLNNKICKFESKISFAGGKITLNEPLESNFSIKAASLFYKNKMEKQP